MKKIIALALFTLTTTISFAQKDEIKALEKAVKNTNFADAKSAASSAEALIGDMDDKLKAKFYYLKAQALYGNGSGTDNDIDNAIQSLDQLKELESSIGKLKYTEQANTMKTDMFNTFLKKANDQFGKQDFSSAKNTFEKMYKISPKDTTYLYNAALSAVKDEDYNTALKHFIALKDLKYTGIKTNYFATNKETNEEEFFNEKKDRDLYVKLKTHINPRDEKVESKRADIVKNIAFIYVSNDENEKALGAIKDAKDEFPEDNNLILTEASVYIKMGNQDKSFELFKEALAKDPENPDLNFNVGVTAMQVEQFDVAKTAFENTLRVKPDYSNAALNLSFLEVSKGNKMNDEMNALGNTAADNKKYDELRSKKNALFKNGSSILEKFIENNPNVKNLDVYNQLANIYSALGEVEKYKATKAKIEEMEGN